MEVVCPLSFQNLRFRHNTMLLCKVQQKKGKRKETLGGYAARLFFLITNGPILLSVGAGCL